MNWSENFNNLFTIPSLISLLTLVVLEIVLGIDNIIFISIIASRLHDRHEQRRARTIGLMLALLIRIGLLFSISWIVGLKEPLFTVLNLAVSGRDLILFAGGVFLLVKTTTEIHNKIEGEEDEVNLNVKKVTLNAIVAQIVFIDIVFSFDSILTAVGVVDNVLIMIGAVIISMIIMLLSSERVSDFINRHPTVKMLALAFLLMIGLLLVLEAFHVHVPKEYVYSSMAFAFLVEMLNMRMRSKKQKKGAAKKKEES
jgi:predicted tellurium resistance membrane protein TerC